MDTLEPAAKPTSTIGKQLLGAAAGAVIALGIYLGYRSITPHLTAYLSIPQVPGHAYRTGRRSAASADIRIANPEHTNEQERLAARARAIAERYRTRPITDTEKEEKPAGITAYPQRLEGISPVASSASSSSTSSVAAVSQVVASSSSSTALHAGTPKNTIAAIQTPPKLPSSGIGLLLAVVFSFLFTIGFIFRSSLDRELSSITLPRFTRSSRKQSR